MKQGLPSSGQGGPELVALLKTGMRLQKGGRLGEAEECYRQALDLHPGNGRALHLLGLLSQQAGNMEAAEAFFLDALASENNEPFYHVSLGVLLARTGRERDATQCFERALELSPGNVHARYQLANALHRLGELDDALRSYEKARILDPDNAVLLVHMGSALNALGKTGKAIELYRRAIQLDPQRAAAYGNLGNALAVEERYDEAIAAFDRCIELQPENPTTYANLGSCYLQRGDWKQAQAAYRETLARAPGDITALAMQAAIHNELGEHNSRDVILDYERLVSLRPIDTPDRYGSVEAFNQELKKLVLSHRSLEYEPHSHTTRLGQQTGNLLDAGEPVFDLLGSIIRDRIRSYLNEYESESGATWQRPVPDHWRLDMWATVLHQGGHQIPHIHPSGWLSGVYYVACPFEQADPGMRGWLEFGEPPANFPFKEPASKMILEPSEGLLVLFPSYFYHRTIPFDDDRPRISIAFDMAPARAAFSEVRTSQGPVG
ncbi:MAG: tetratricopeptide repeat protein [Gammaproteobacteria bacterium]|nr:MAG: tetratricopeptide repeat protein [Gammaproteobacteria bacterium]